MSAPTVSKFTRRRRTLLGADSEHACAPMKNTLAPTVITLARPQTTLAYATSENTCVPTRTTRARQQSTHLRADHRHFLCAFRAAGVTLHQAARVGGQVVQAGRERFLRRPRQREAGPTSRQSRCDGRAGLAKAVPRAKRDRK